MLIQQKGRKTIITIEDKTKEFKTAFLNKLSFKDAINYINDRLSNK